MASGLRHGGDVGAAEAAYGRPAAGWLDLSTGINRIPYPIDGIDPAHWQRLPLGTERDALLDAARAAYGAPPDAPAVAAPGTQAIIQWLPRLRPAAEVCIVAPTYGEHAEAWRAAGHHVRTAPSLHDAAGDIIVIVHPNNPDGRTDPPAALIDAAGRQAAARGLLIVDEAFCDVAPGASVCRAAGMPGLVILRSFGKFFGLAGLRLGFQLGDAELCRTLGSALGPWAVAGPALHVGRTALIDKDWQTATRARLAADAARLRDLLQAKGFRIVGGTDLYVLTASDDAAARKDTLGHAGIMVRSFEAEPTWLRFGIPGPAAEWQRLDAAL